MKQFLAFLSGICLVFWCIARIYYAICFDINCGEYLKQAADANTVELAKERLAIALKYIEAKQLTQGFTSIVYNSPSDDIGFWYNNLKKSFQELQALPEDASSLEKSNMLMKLRETLLDNGSRGTKLTCPEGISIYPHNTFAAVFGIFLLIIFLACGGFWLIELA